MAFETLKDLKKINGFDVTRTAANLSEHRPIFIDDENNHIAFQIQKGPINECGTNGCQVDEMIATAKIMLEGLNKQFPSRQNSLAITKLEEAMHWLTDRRNERVSRGVEGYSQA